MSSKWGCFVCKNRRNDARLAKCGTCGRARQSMRHAVEVQGRLYLALADCTSHFPTLKVYRLSEPEMRRKIMLPMDGDNLRQCVIEAIKHSFHSHSNQEVEELEGQGSSRAGTAESDGLLVNPPSPTPSLFQQVLDNAKSIAYDAATNKFVKKTDDDDSSTGSSVGYSRSLEVFTKSMKNVVEKNVERKAILATKAQEEEENPVFLYADPVTVEEPKEACTLCEYRYPASQLPGTMSFKSLADWRAKRGAPFNPTDKRMNRARIHDDVPLCLFCTSLFDADFSLGLEEASHFSSVGIETDPVLGIEKFDSIGSKRQMAKMVRLAKSLPPAGFQGRPLSRMRQQIIATNLKTLSERNTDPAARFFYTTKGTDTSYIDQERAGRALRNKYADIVMVKRAQALGVVERQQAEERMERRRLALEKKSAELKPGARETAHSATAVTVNNNSSTAATKGKGKPERKKTTTPKRSQSAAELSVREGRQRRRGKGASRGASSSITRNTPAKSSSRRRSLGHDTDASSVFSGSHSVASQFSSRSGKSAKSARSTRSLMSGKSTASFRSAASAASAAAKRKQGKQGKAGGSRKKTKNVTSGAGAGPAYLDEDDVDARVVRELKRPPPRTRQPLVLLVSSSGGAGCGGVTRIELPPGPSPAKRRMVAEGPSSIAGPGRVKFLVPKASQGQGKKEVAAVRTVGFSGSGRDEDEDEDDRQLQPQHQHRAKPKRLGSPPAAPHTQARAQGQGQGQGQGKKASKQPPAFNVSAAGSVAFGGPSELNKQRRLERQNAEAGGHVKVSLRLLDNVNAAYSASVAPSGSGGGGGDVHYKSHQSRMQPGPAKTKARDAAGSGKSKGKKGGAGLGKVSFSPGPGPDSGYASVNAQAQAQGQPQGQAQGQGKTKRLRSPPPAAFHGTGEFDERLDNLDEDDDKEQEGRGLGQGEADEWDEEDEEGEGWELDHHYQHQLQHQQEEQQEKQQKMGMWNQFDEDEDDESVASYQTFSQPYKLDEGSKIIPLRTFWGGEDIDQPEPPASQKRQGEFDDDETVDSYKWGLTNLPLPYSAGGGLNFSPPQSSSALALFARYGRGRDEDEDGEGQGEEGSRSSSPKYGLEPFLRRNSGSPSSNPRSPTNMVLLSRGLSGKGRKTGSGAEGACVKGLELLDGGSRKGSGRVGGKFSSSSASSSSSPSASGGNKAQNALQLLEGGERDRDASSPPFVAGTGGLGAGVARGPNALELLEEGRSLFAEGDYVAEDSPRDPGEVVRRLKRRALKAD